LRKVEVSKGLSEAHVKKVIKKAMSDIKNCNQSITDGVSIPAGEVVFYLVIGPEGNVLKAYTEKGRTEYNDFEMCVLKGLKTLNFLTKDGRKEVSVKVVFILK
jgi:hypothetical protein